MLSRGGSERYFELMMASAVALTCAHSLALSLSLSRLWPGVVGDAAVVSEAEEEEVVIV